MVLKGEKSIALWWLTNWPNWFRKQEMEKWWQKCRARHLRGKCGRAGKTAQLTLMEKDAKKWIQDSRNSGRDRHAFPQARVSWLTDRLLRIKRDAWGSCDSKGERGDKRTWEEIIRKALQKHYLATKTMFANSLWKKTQTFSGLSLVLNLGRS